MEQKQPNNDELQKKATSEAPTANSGAESSSEDAAEEKDSNANQNRDSKSPEPRR